MTEQSPTGARLQERIHTYVEELARLTDQARISAAMQAYLETCARIHRYSWHNTLLILLARSQARLVAGYHTWLKLKRHVRQGEKGIPILAPIVVRDLDAGEDGQAILRCKVVYVFDIARAEGEALPPPPDWKSPARSRELSDRLIVPAMISQGQIREDRSSSLRSSGLIRVRTRRGSRTRVTYTFSARRSPSSNLPGLLSVWPLGAKGAMLASDCGPIGRVAESLWAHWKTSPIQSPPWLPINTGLA